MCGAKYAPPVAAAAEGPGGGPAAPSSPRPSRRRRTTGSTGAAAPPGGPSWGPAGPEGAGLARTGPAGTPPAGWPRGQPAAAAARCGGTRGSGCWGPPPRSGGGPGRPPAAPLWCVPAAAAGAAPCAPRAAAPPQWTPLQWVALAAHAARTGQAAFRPAPGAHCCAPAASKWFPLGRPGDGRSAAPHTQTRRTHPAALRTAGGGLLPTRPELAQPQRRPGSCSCSIFPPPPSPPSSAAGSSRGAERGRESPDFPPAFSPAALRCCFLLAADGPPQELAAVGTGAWPRGRAQCCRSRPTQPATPGAEAPSRSFFFPGVCFSWGPLHAPSCAASSRAGGRCGCATAAGRAAHRTG
eukprot:m.182012 g.182012  ORF g.182012 m.182012 type:complete len:353 (+) comp21496_c3_seq2:818-1876(+)